MTTALGFRLSAFGLIAALVGIAAADPARTDYLARVLSAVRDAGPDRRASIERSVYASSRARCGADAGTPTISCMTAEARSFCAADARCLLVADVAIANLRAANDWVDAPTRARLVRSSSDYRAALAAELHRRYAALAAELALLAGADAASIDRLCTTRDRVVHACRDDDAACVPSLSYARCAAALVWFVGESKQQ